MPRCTPRGPSAAGAARPVVSVFNGPGPGQLRLHTFSPDLGPASPIVDARIVQANRQEQRQGFGQALSCRMRR